MNPARLHKIQEGVPGNGPVVYWMSRDQRVGDNWALIHAQETALQMERPLVAIFCLSTSFLGAAARQYLFMLEGLAEVEKGLGRLDVDFILLFGRPGDRIPRYLENVDASLLVTDFDPLKVKARWRLEVARTVRVPFHEVDAHNVVPCRRVSDKAEYGAYTIRPKIERLLDEFLDPFPRLKKHPYPFIGSRRSVDWSAAAEGLEVDSFPGKVDWIKPGEVEAKKALRKFIKTGLASYGESRNDPNLNGQSNLSPYFHFGHLSAQRAAMEVLASKAPDQARRDFIEELVIRRELADNFCLYNRHYDSVEGFPNWARQTLADHHEDPREYFYEMDLLDRGKTHDELWNAAQLQMVKTGKMHGYARMYWAKKILEWSPNPESALAAAIHLNDRYSLDGRDPNGYAGVAWSIGGLHDRPWKERPVFGKIRYMNLKGAKRKFDVERYVKTWAGEAKED